MPNYRRTFRPGGTFFFTQVTYHRLPLFHHPTARFLLRGAIADCRTNHPFTIDAFVLLPDHLHTIWTLPEDDPDFSIRWNLIKRSFTLAWLSTGANEAPISESRRQNRRRGVWQRRFWEHRLRDQDDLNHHLNYIHFNPVKHNLAPCPHAWPHSTFSQSVSSGLYPPNWHCVCDGQSSPRPVFDNLNLTAME